MKVINETYALLSTALSQQVRVGDMDLAMSRQRVLDLWMERTDVQNYVVVGDPAVHLPA